ncbi:hypothetical protein [Desulfovibrio intestinalis]|uniref:Uncharacterized protein n=1 Tax=Desulfovibrio intestinalis TaxID=58621 RepID=A0A7W8FFF5_9BACT|nr:hypothetical protein [Desulfovibrio intestinalis]MBB5143883.1 hypothetical protein [Desulfovibrio intestinalis]
MSKLQVRLKNCIQTILELEPDMKAGVWGRYFDMELSSLKDYLSQVDQMDLAEEDVKRLENATATFLSELKLSRKGNIRKKRLLQ